MTKGNTGMTKRERGNDKRESVDDKMRAGINELTRGVIMKLLDRTIKIGMIILVFVFAQAWAECAEAEMKTYTSAVFWRADGNGDFPLPKITGTTYVINKSVPTDGLVKEVTASWVFTGEVTLEVSVDGGRHYHKVVNAVPLTAGFAKGDRLKWRAQLSKESVLSEVKISYVDTSGIVATFGEPELSGFKYRKKIHISGSSRTLYNYQVDIVLGETKEAENYDINCRGNILKSFKDVRFTAADGETLLAYYLEAMTGVSPARAGKIWVKIPEIPTIGINIYVYYGNADAKDTSVVENVFKEQDENGGWLKEYTDVIPEPVTISEPKQEGVVVPAFRNTGLNGIGNVVLLDGYDSGQYTTADLLVPFDTRIFVTAWEGDEISVDLSADNGLTYKKDCDPDTYYYVSLDDFSAGKQPKAKVRFERGVRDAELELLEVDYAPGIITMIVPNGGELWQAGTTKDIMWSALEYDFFYPVTIEYARKSAPRTFTKITKTENNGLYAWTIPSDLLADDLLIRISDANESKINDSSDGVFEVEPYEGLAALAEGEEALVEETPEEGRAYQDISAVVTIAGDETIKTTGDISFKKLVIGDGTGVHQSKLILIHGINPASGDILVRKGGELVQANNDPQSIVGDLTVEEGGILTHRENEDSKTYVLNFSAENITIKPEGMITVDDKGYVGGKVRADAKGKGAGKYLEMGALGGSHGGKGGRAETQKEAIEQERYDEKRKPSDLGSGGSGGWFAAGGAGGGSITLNARSDFRIDGSITANGENGKVLGNETEYEAAGGAGGSIYLTAGEFFSDTAVITAEGGSGGVTGGGGGGGRIHLKAPIGAIKGKLEVKGGTGFEPGKGGSLIVE